MPLHLLPISRRVFVGRSLAAGAALVLPFGRAAAASDEYMVALLSDTHVSENLNRAPNGQNIAENLRHVVRWALQTRPSAVFINGDCAFRDGQPGDYEQLALLLRPLRDAGVPIHLTLGNHDDREVFYRVLAGERRDDPPVESRHVSIVETPHADFFLLDSLKATMIAQGELGDQQRAWLAAALDARADKPAIVMLHHNPMLAVPAQHQPGGLLDTTALFEILLPRRHVKAYVHGHIHQWGLRQHEGIHIINTPAVGYVGRPEAAATGFVAARLRPDGMSMTRYTIDPADPRHDQNFDVAWRGA